MQFRPRTLLAWLDIAAALPLVAIGTFYLTFFLPMLIRDFPDDRSAILFVSIGSIIALTAGLLLVMHALTTLGVRLNRGGRIYAAIGEKGVLSCLEIAIGLVLLFIGMAFVLFACTYTEDSIWSRNDTEVLSGAAVWFFFLGSRLCVYGFRGRSRRLREAL